MIGSTRPLSVRRLFAVLAILVVLTAACGGGDSGTAPDESAGSDESDTPTGDAESSDDADVDAETGADPEDEPSEPGPVELAGGEADIYCRLALENDQASDLFDPTAGPEAAEKFVRESQAALAQAIVVAPPGLRIDLATIAEGIDALAEILEANDWDFLASLEPIELLTASSEQEAAQDRIDAWEELNCSQSVQSSEESASGSIGDAFASPEALEALLGSDAGRELLISGLVENVDLTRDQAGCLLDNLDLPAVAALAEGADSEADLIAELFAALDVCGISLADFG